MYANGLVEKLAPVRVIAAGGRADW